LILEGPQGIRKSTALRTIAGEYFTDELADLGSKNATMQTRDVWIIELSELDNLGHAEVARIKALVALQIGKAAKATAYASDESYAAIPKMV
jgi:predicted P-loop ATPase